ncbi:MAG: hypothetical protein WCK89_13580 [bacterium]
MSDRFDLRQMLQETKLDEKVFRSKPVLLTQKDIKEMREKLRKDKAERRRAQ